MTLRETIRTALEIEKATPSPEHVVMLYADAVAALCDEHERLEKTLADCYRATGADPDGNEDWRLAEHALAEVKRLAAERED